MKPPIRLTVVVLITLLSLANLALGETDATPVVSGVHWITIHARTPEAFDSLHAMFTRDMKLPVFFGPETHGPRRYVAVGAGRVILELCGPFPTVPTATTMPWLASTASSFGRAIRLRPASRGWSPGRSSTNPRKPYPGTRRSCK